MKLLCLAPIIFVSLRAQSGAWHPERTMYPRTLFHSSEIVALRQAVVQSPSLKSIYAGLLATVRSQSTDQRTRSNIAKTAAFALALDLDVDAGATNSFTPGERQQLREKVIGYLRGIDPTVISPTTNYQWRAIELMQFCQAYDMLRGDGIASDTMIENKLAQFASQAMRELGGSDFLLQKNNLTIKLASALGMTAIVLNGYTSPSTALQPASWIARAMTFIDDAMWNYQSDGTKASGYSESPYYFRYAMMNALPFFLAMKNFNGDWTESYSGKSIRSPWFDPRYDRLYEWTRSILLPDGRLPAFDDSYIDSYFPELSLLALKGDSSSRFAWNNWIDNRPMTANELATQLTSTYDSRVEFIVARAQPSTGPATSSLLPDAGYAIFRGSSSPTATYGAMIGKHGRARTHQSLIGSGHKHANETAFMLAAGGEILLTEPGYYSYDSRDSIIRSPHHNIILVDGKGPDMTGYGNFLFGVDTFITDTLTSDVCTIASCSTSYQNTAIKRRVYFLDTSFFIIRDNVSSNSPHVFTHQLHGIGLESDGTATLDASKQAAIWSAGAMKLFARVDAVNDSRDTPALSFVTRKHAPTYRQFEDHSALYTSMTGKDVAFTTLLFPYPRDTQPELQITNNDRLILYAHKSGSKTLMAITSKKGETIEAQGDRASIATDASFAFYASDQSQTDRFDLVADDAGRMSVNERMLFWSPAKITAVLRYTRSSINGFIRGNGTDSLELATRFMPATITGRPVTKWHMNSHKIVFEKVGQSFDFEVQLSDVPTAVSSNADPSDAHVVLRQNYPNPIGVSSQRRAETIIEFQLPARDHVTLDVYDHRGARISRLLEGEFDAGSYRVPFDARTLHSGHYFYRLHSSAGVVTRTMTVSK